MSALADNTVDVIELAAGTYSWDGVQINVDRTSRPLMIRPASGATVTFVGSGSASGGVFFFGYSSPTKWITMDGFTFDGITLGQAGVFEIRSSDHLTLKNMTFKNLKRGGNSDKPYKSWVAYVSMGSGIRNNDHLLLDNWTMLAPTVSRDVSAIQIASSSLTNGSIRITNMSLVDYAYAFYGEVPTTDLVLDGWTLTNVGNHTTPASVRFTADPISGTYRNIHATGSDRVLNDSTGVMVDSGGNSGM